MDQIAGESTCDHCQFPLQVPVLGQVLASELRVPASSASGPRSRGFGFRTKAGSHDLKCGDGSLGIALRGKGFHLLRCSASQKESVDGMVLAGSHGIYLSLGELREERSPESVPM